MPSGWPRRGKNVEGKNLITEDVPKAAISPAAFKLHGAYWDYTPSFSLIVCPSHIETVPLTGHICEKEGALSQYALHNLNAVRRNDCVRNVFCHEIYFSVSCLDSVTLKLCDSDHAVNIRFLREEGILANVLSPGRSFSLNCSWKRFALAMDSATLTVLMLYV